MKSLTDLYKKKEGAAVSAAPSTGAPTTGKAPEPEKDDVPIMETPPGLPQEYIDANLMNRPLPQIIDMETAQAEQVKPLNIRAIINETMSRATDVPYVPGYESKVVTERINQGPRVFLSRAQKEKFYKELDEKKPLVSPDAKAPSIAHPDTLKPGTFIKDESRAYRPS